MVSFFIDCLIMSGPEPVRTLTFDDSKLFRVFDLQPTKHYTLQIAL